MNEYEEELLYRAEDTYGRIGTMRPRVDANGKVRWEFMGSIARVPGTPQSVATFNEGVNFLKTSGYRTYDEIIGGIPTSGSTGHALYASGRYRYHYLEALSKAFSEAHPDVETRLVREGWNTSNDTASNRLLKTLGGKDGEPQRGFAVVNDESTSVLRLFRGDEELTADQILKFMSDTFGFSINDPTSEKLSKRLKTIMSLSGMGFMEKGQIKVGVFNPEEMPAFAHLTATKETASKEATDGIGWIRRDLLARQARALEKSAKETQKQAKLAGQTIEGMRLRRTAATELEAAQELRRGIKRGVVRNYSRILGMNITELGIDDQGMFRPLSERRNPELIKIQEMLKAQGLDVETAGLQTKGDLTMRVFDRETWARHIPKGIDVLIPGAMVNPEISMSKYALMTNEPHKIKRAIYADVQTMSSYIDEFNPDLLVKTLTEDVEAITDILKGGQIPEPRKRKASEALDRALNHVLEASKDLNDMDVGERAKVLRARQYAQKVTDWIGDGYSLSDNPQMMQQFLRSYQAFLTPSKPGRNGLPGMPKLRLRVPDAMAGPLTAAADVAEGYISLRGDGLYINMPKFDQVREALGGPDQDDTLRIMLRHDLDTNSLRVFASRNPTSLGEHLFLKVRNDDEIVRSAFRERGITDIDDIVAERDAARAAVATAKSELDQAANVKRDVTRARKKLVAAQQALAGREWDNEINEIVQANLDQFHSIRSSRMPTSLGFDKNGRFVATGINAKGKIAGASDYFDYIDHDAKFAKQKTQARLAGMSHADIQRWRIETQKETRGLLGTFENARMVAGRFARDHELKGKDKTTFQRFLDENGLERRQIKLVRQEAVVDASKLGGVEFLQDMKGNKIDLSKISQEILESIGYNVSLMRAAGLDEKVAGVDPFLAEWMLRDRSESRAAFIRGIEAANEKTGENFQFKDALRALDSSPLARTWTTSEDFIKKWYETTVPDLIDETSFPAHTVNRASNLDYMSDVADLLQEHSRLRDEFKLDEAILDPSLEGAADYFKARMITVDQKAVDAGVLEFMGQWIGDDGPDEAFYNRMSALLEVASKNPVARQIVNAESPDMIEGGASMMRLTRETLNYNRLRSAIDVSGDTPEDVAKSVARMPRGDQELVGRFLGDLFGQPKFNKAGEIRRSKLPRQVQSSIDLTENPTTRAQIEQTIDRPIMTTAARMERELASTALSGVSETTYERFAKKHVDAIMGTKYGKAAGIAGAGLLAWGVVRSFRDKDRTLEEMQGPVALPGGNPYMGQTSRGMSYSSDVQQSSGEMGVTYDVRARGSFSATGLAQSMIDMTGGVIGSANYYSSRNLSGRDQEREIERAYS